MVIQGQAKPHLKVVKIHQKMTLDQIQRNVNPCPQEEKYLFKNF